MSRRQSQRLGKVAIDNLGLLKYWLPPLHVPRLLHVYCFPIRTSKMQNPLEAQQASPRHQGEGPLVEVEGQNQRFQSFREHPQHRPWGANAFDNAACYVPPAPPLWLNQSVLTLSQGNSDCLAILSPLGINKFNLPAPNSPDAPVIIRCCQIFRLSSPPKHDQPELLVKMLVLDLV